MEDFRGLGEPAAGVGGALDAAQVGAVGELDAGQVEGPAVVARFVDRLFEGVDVGPGFGDGRQVQVNPRPPGRTTQTGPLPWTR